MTTEQYKKMNGWSNMYFGKRRDNADVFRRYILSSLPALDTIILKFHAVNGKRIVPCVI